VTPAAKPFRLHSKEKQRPERMRQTTLLTLLLCAGTLSAATPEAPPPWAYGFKDLAPAAATPPAPAPAANAVPPDTRLHSLPGTTLQFTRAQIGDRFAPADWFPGDHPEMPTIVANGKKPDVWACALCHYPNGHGRPENAPIAGLPVNYFVAQMHAFRDGTRKSADSRKANTAIMAAIARGMTDEEILESANYFAAIKVKPWIRVVETKTVPETTTSVGLFLPVANGKQEPLGARIIEVPEDVEAVEVLRNPRVGFVAYVPQGYINRGAVLVTTGRGKTQPCGTCHGSDLKGMGDVPAIAGRSPSYLMRQMVDMRAHTRTGPGAELMMPVVGQMSNADLMAVAAFVASRAP
jgi:cytochrome c553